MRTVDDIYLDHCRDTAHSTCVHLPRLFNMTVPGWSVVEFGCKRGASTSAFLAAGALYVDSYDLVITEQARELERAADGRLVLHEEDTLTADVPDYCDLIFFDSLHTFRQLAGEIGRHSSASRKLLVFHDTITFGSVGADGETGRHSWQYVPGVSVPHEHLGIRPAIDDLMIIDRSLRIRSSYSDGHGLLVLERVP